MPEPTDAAAARPQHVPFARELDDLELLIHGALAPLDGFEATPGPVTLQVPPPVADLAAAHGELELLDPEGVPLAVVSIESTYAAGDLVGIVGPVTALAHREFGAFRRLYLSPGEARSKHDAAAATVPVAAPLTVADLAQVADRAAGAPVVLLALAGTGTPKGISPNGLIRATLAAARRLPDAEVVVVSLAAHDHGPADAALRERVVAAYASGPVLTVSGDGELPTEVADIVQADRPDPGRQGLVVFFTGLSGSGKSTLARALHDVILERGDRTVTSLDGDVVRRNLSAGLTFSKADRETNIRRIGWVAAEISRHRGIAICSPIAPFAATRQQVRAMVEEAGGAFVLIHVATTLAECERRDRKGLYAKARRGEIPEFTGISSPYEPPDDPMLRVDTEGRSVPDVLEEVLGALYDRDYLTDPDAAESTEALGTAT